MSGYKVLAKYYDRLTSDIDYKKIKEFTLEIYRKYTNKKPNIILDLGCGTGNLAIEFAGSGIEVIGIDISSDMLGIAYEKSKDANLDILFSMQDMSKFELYGTVDLVTCYLDTVNHIIEPDKVKEMFRLVENFLDPGGLFVFDVNSKYKFEKIYSDNVYYESYDDLTYIWQNSYDEKSRIAEFEITFFVKDNDGRYSKTEECSHERFYSEQEIKDFIKNLGFERLEVYDGFSTNPPKKNSDRILHILKKR